MKFIEVQHIGDKTKGIIPVDDILGVTECEDTTCHIMLNRGEHGATLKASTPYKEIRDALIDYDKYSYRKGYDDGVKAMYEHSRLCKAEEPPRMKLSTVEQMMENINREIEAVQMPIMRESNDYHAGMFEGLSQALKIIDTQFEGAKSCI